MNELTAAYNKAKFEKAAVWESESDKKDDSTKESPIKHKIQNPGMQGAYKDYMDAHQTIKDIIAKRKKNQQYKKDLEGEVDPSWPKWTGRAGLGVAGLGAGWGGYETIKNILNMRGDRAPDMRHDTVRDVIEKMGPKKRTAHVMQTLRMDPRVDKKKLDNLLRTMPIDDFTTMITGKGADPAVKSLLATEVAPTVYNEAPPFEIKGKPKPKSTQPKAKGGAPWNLVVRPPEQTAAPKPPSAPSILPEDQLKAFGRKTPKNWATKRRGPAKPPTFAAAMQRDPDFLKKYMEFMRSKGQNVTPAFAQQLGPTVTNKPRGRNQAYVPEPGQRFAQPRAHSGEPLPSRPKVQLTGVKQKGITLEDLLAQRTAGKGKRTARQRLQKTFGKPRGKFRAAGAGKILKGTAGSVIAGLLTAYLANKLAPESVEEKRRQADEFSRTSYDDAIRHHMLRNWIWNAYQRPDAAEYLSNYDKQRLMDTFQKQLEGRRGK